MTRERVRKHDRICMTIIHPTEREITTTQTMREYVLETTKETFNRLAWMFKVKDCRRICLFCEYYKICRNDGTGKKGEKQK